MLDPVEFDAKLNLLLSPEDKRWLDEWRRRRGLPMTAGESEATPELRAAIKGRIEGRAALVTRQLAIRFGPLSGEAQTLIRISSSAELDKIGERLLTAATLEEAIGEEVIAPDP